MANGKKISEQPIADSLTGNELIPFANNGTNGTVAADTIKEYAQGGLDDKYADKSDTYTKTEVDGLVDGVKGDMPTKVSELENDSKYQTESDVDEKIAELQTSVDGKVDKVDGKGLSSNDFTDADKTKLDGVDNLISENIKENSVYIDEIDFYVIEDWAFNNNNFFDGDVYPLDSDIRESIIEKIKLAYQSNKRVFIKRTQPFFTECTLADIRMVGDTFGSGAIVWVSESCYNVKAWFRFDFTQGCLIIADKSYSTFESDEKFVQKENGKGLSTNDFTDEDKAKLDKFEFVLTNDDEIEDGLHQIASSNDYRNELKERGYVVYHDVKYKVKDCGVTSDSYPWIITEGAIITANEDGELSDHTQKNVARSVYIWFDTILHYQPYGSIIPSKVSELTNDLKYQTETQLANSIAIAYESLDSQLVDEYTHLDNKKVDKVTGKGLSTNDYTTDEKNKLGALPTNAELTTTLATKADKTAIVDMLTKTEASDTYQPKGNYLTSHQSLADYAKTATMNTELAKKVDKVSGKQLSTEDFTTLLKQKLDGLTNYDDSTLTSELNALKSRLDTLVGSGDVTAVIDTFQEIEAFLQGVTNTQTLTGLLQEMKSEIITLCADTYAKVKSANDLISSSNEFTFVGNGYNKSVYINYKAQGGTAEILGYEFYNGSNTKTYAPLKASKYVVPNGTSSQFLKADGSVDSTAYLPKANGIGTNATFEHEEFTKALTVKRNTDGGSFITFSNLNGVLGYLGITVDNIPTYHTGSASYKLWHAGNDGSGSGLDADLLDGLQSTDFLQNNSQIYNSDLNNITIAGKYKIGTDVTNYPSNYFSGPNGSILCHYTFDANSARQVFYRYTIDSNAKIYTRSKYNNVWQKWCEVAFTDSNVASADKLTTKQLTNEDLNEIKDTDFSTYFANSSNNCANKPSDLTGGFRLDVGRIGGSYIIQILLATNGRIYKRRFTSAWTSWQYLITTDDPAPNLKTTQLTNEDLNTIKDVGISSYALKSNNTCANKPESTAGFIGTLQVFGYNETHIVQIYTKLDTQGGTIYKRCCISNTWYSWKKMLTEDDIASLVSRIEALEARPTIASVDSLPSTPNNNTLYAIPE